MAHRRALFFASLALALVSVASPALAATRTGGIGASAADDDIPGAPLSASPVVDTLNAASDTDDVSRVWLEEGDVISASLTISGSAGAFDPRLFLYGPAATSLLTADEVTRSHQAQFPKSFSYTATQAGYHYLDVWQDPLPDSSASGTTTLSWSVWRPVYRFYNMQLGTHFYSATASERRFVIATLSSIYQYEGPAYGVNPYTNADLLWRFYRPGTGTHFYTADPDEMTRVATTMTRTYQLEGTAYSVSRWAGPGRIAVHRFFNLRNGTHFYSASEAEAQYVQATLAHTYRYEGIAFFLAR